MLNQKFTRKHALSRPTTGFFVNDDLLKYVMLCSLVKSSYVMVSYEIMTITITIAITIAITITVLHDKEHVMINVCYIQCFDMMMI